MSRVALRGMTALLLLLSGCTESVLIRTHPDGARVSVNEQDLGISPVTLTVKSRDMGDASTYHFVVEKERYETAQGFIPVVRSRARIFGMICTFGLLHIVRQTVTFPDWYDIGLQPVTHVVVDKPSRSLTDTLHDLETAHSQGLITDEEYRLKRAQILSTP